MTLPNLETTNTIVMLAGKTVLDLSLSLSPLNVVLVFQRWYLKKRRSLTTFAIGRNLPIPSLIRHADGGQPKRTGTTSTYTPPSRAQTRFRVSTDSAAKVLPSAALSLPASAT